MILNIILISFLFMGGMAMLGVLMLILAWELCKAGIIKSVDVARFVQDALLRLPS